MHLDAMQCALYEFAAWDSMNYLRWGTVYLEDARSLPDTAPSVFRPFSEGQSFSIKNKPGPFSAVGGDQKLEKTIDLSSMRSDGVIVHAKHKQYVTRCVVSHSGPIDNISFGVSVLLRVRGS